VDIVQRHKVERFPRSGLDGDAPWGRMLGELKRRTDIRFITNDDDQ